MKTKTLSTLVLGLALMLSSCKKVETGPEGKAGSDGNANVTSTTYVVSSWTSSSIWYTNLNVPALTSSNLNSAAVQAFFSTNSGTDWAALPYTQVSSTNYFFNFVTSTNLVQVQWVYNGVGTGSSPNSFYSTTVQIKVVVIPPAMKKANIDYNNYSELKEAYDLKD